MTQAKTIRERLTECVACIDAFLLKQPKVKRICNVRNELVEMSATVKSFVQMMENIIMYQATTRSRYYELDKISTMVSGGEVLIASLEKLYLTLNWLSLSRCIADNDEAKINGKISNA
jgi:hypothetical protein